MEYKQSVFQFNVSIANTFSVAIIHSQDELLEEPACFVLWKTSSGNHIVKHIPIGDILHDNGEVGSRGENFFELDNVRVKEMLMVHDFTVSVFDIFIVTVEGKEGGKVNVRYKGK